MTDLYVSWSDYHQKIETLALKVYQSGWQFNQIVCVAKGGLRVGDIFCRLYELPLAIMSASSYRGANKRDRGKIILSSHLSMTTPNLGDKVLLVDDLVDSGTSLIESVNWLSDRYGSSVTEIRTAVIWYKACSVAIPDYYVDYLPHNPWIHQPFENYEQTTMSDLANRVNQTYNS